MPDTKPPLDDPAQSQRFIDMAREVNAEEDAGAFETLFGKVIQLLPAKAVKPPLDKE
jgi:hypothetical protein